MASIQTKEIEMVRKLLKHKFDTAAKPVELRLTERLAVVAKAHPKANEKELHELALKDPKYAADAAIYDKMYNLFDAEDKKLLARSKVGSGLFGGKTSHEDVLKALEALKHDAKNGAEHHDAKGHDTKEKSTEHHSSAYLPHPKPHLPHPRPLPPHHVPSAHDPNSIQATGGWAAMLARIQKEKKAEHATPKDGLVGDSAASPSSWVSATSVGVVVAICACVAAFAVVRRRQRQSESTAPRADGYATLV